MYTYKTSKYAPYEKIQEEKPSKCQYYEFCCVGKCAFNKHLRAHMLKTISGMSI